MFGWHSVRPLYWRRKLTKIWRLFFGWRINDICDPAFLRYLALPPSTLSTLHFYQIVLLWHFSERVDFPQRLLQIALLQIEMCGHLFHENVQTFNRLPPIHSQHMSNLQMSKGTLLKLMDSNQISYFVLFDFIFVSERHRQLRF